MRKLSILVVALVFSVFMLLWNQEYIQTMCANNLLCNGLNHQSIKVYVFGEKVSHQLIQHPTGVNSTQFLATIDRVADDSVTKNSRGTESVQRTWVTRGTSSKAEMSIPRKHNKTVKNATGLDKNSIQKAKTVIQNSTTVAPILYYKEMEPRTGDRNIIFLETRCLLNQNGSYSHKGLLLHKRQACAVESAAQMNPNQTVYLLYSCPIIGTLQDFSDYVKAVFTYPNVRLWRVDIARLFANTPLEKWNFWQQIVSSQWPSEHASDVLRFLTLWKYGGTYLDLDVILLKSLEGLSSNYVGVESSDNLASGVLNFATEGVGHDVATQCVEELRTNFRGDIWIHNGPGLITRVMLRMCDCYEVTELSTEKCKGFHILSDKEFFPIPYQSWQLFFNETTSSDTMTKIQDSFGVHLWNKLSKDEAVVVGSKQPYSLLARKTCPRTYSAVGHFL
ncbi:lactosylceramide 4-alpha-galactosyltransferase-like [Periplaneta americana]|uniref:lactosylceramide 4-alpha-galactosyltransferase-like n=1 Tax=Periplaneta americana TaxID=6978 RepID=UPI0037E869BA